MKTQDEILAKMESMKSSDFMGTKTGDLVSYLDFDHAQPYLKPECTAEIWDDHDRTDEAVKKEISGYLDFAWGKANGCRGISAARSLEHFEIWFWLIDETKLSESCSGGYEHYGKAQLVKITEWAGLDVADFDDGRRVNTDKE